MKKKAKASEKKAGELNDVYAPRFAKLLDEHLQRLGWDKTVLSEETEKISSISISPAQLSRWAKGQRSVSRAMAIRAAVAISLEYEKRCESGQFTGSTSGLDYLDSTLQEFLNVAGYPGNLELSQPRNVVWNQIQKSKSIEVGYTSIPPWAVPGNEVPTGASIEIARRVTMLLGLNVRWHEFDWSELPHAIRERRIDVVAPILMNMPSRLYEYRFSDPIGTEDKFTFGLGLLASTSAFGAGVKPSYEHISESYHLGFVAGEVGEIASSLLAKKFEPQPLKDIESALDWLSEPNQSVPRVVASESTTCEALAQRHKSTIVLLPPPAAWEKVRFGICFGVHPDEPKLAIAINHCLKLLRGVVGDIVNSSAPKK